LVIFALQITLILTDIIHLLPDNIANQIAAGEVIQRPGSAVKELLENAVDAEADEIKLIINDAGKALVQVIDNGKGMSETDARLAFERHATSKIKNIDDLFRIKTMGFRGEALASIAAVAQVELKTKRADDPAGTFVEIENSRVIKQEPVAFNKGTSIAMKNLFFNENKLFQTNMSLTEPFYLSIVLLKCNSEGASSKIDFKTIERAAKAFIAFLPRNQHILSFLT
jgi:DNA mismatch repair protein MutL